MESLSIANLIQSATMSVCILGAFLLWRTPSFKGIALLFALCALAALINILEESGLTRDIYLISPIFVMLFGPAMYLAVKRLVNGVFDKLQWLHLLPALPMLLMTSQPHLVIAVGSVWRIIYAVFTTLLLLKFKRRLDEQRSDSDDFSYRWLIYLVLITALFNLVDIARLNSQHLIPVALNQLGQVMNNVIWLFAIIISCIKLTEQGSPVESGTVIQATDDNVEVLATDNPEDYRVTFDEVDRLVKNNQWYLKPRLTLAELAELTGLQTREISRAINLVAEQSFNEYINRYRIDYVCRMIPQKQQQSLTRIAEDAGFSSKASFNHVFKQMKGVTPSEYKASLKV